MQLEKAINAVTEFREVLDDNSKAEYKKILNKHLTETNEMIDILSDNKEYLELFTNDAEKINQALSVLE